MKNGKRFLRTLSIYLAFALFLAPHTILAQSLHTKTFKLVGASTNSFPPMNMLDKGANLIGFGRELADAVIKEVGGSIEHIHSSQWVEVLDWLDKGKADFIHDTGFTYERDKFLDYTDPILEMPEMIFVRPDEFSITDIDSLKGKTVACVDQHISHLYLQQFPEISIFVVKTPVEGMYELISGNVDSFVYPKQIVLYLSQRLRLHDKLKSTGKPLRTLSWSMVVKEGNSEVLQLLNEGIAQVRKSGEYDRIYNKWWGDRVLSGYTKRELFIITGVSTGAVLAVLMSISLLLFSRGVRRKQKMLEIEIYERKQTEEKLRTSEEKFRLIAETIKEVFWIGAAGWGEVYYVSPAYQEVWGRSTQSLVDDPQSWLDSVHPEDRNFLRRIIQKKVPGNLKKVEFPPYRVVRPDGTIRWVLARAFPVCDKNNQVIRIVGIAEDITDRKNSEEEKKKLEAELLQAHKMEAVGTLAGGIAHDFNNLLSGIIGYAELIQYRVAPDSGIGKDIAEVVGAGKRAADLVKQILTFSRKTAIEKKPLQPHLIVKEALRMLRASFPSTLNLQENIDSACGSILIDPTNLHQVVVNLCTNASQAMPKEKGTLDVNLQQLEVKPEDVSKESGIAPGSFIILSVSDTGIGMDKATIERIFEPYFTTKEVGSGTGLGLAVTHGIVQDAGGFIRVASTPGLGTTFDIYFPVLKKEETDDTDIGEEGSDLLKGREHILVVDDEPFLVRVIQRQLEERGYEVTATSDSRDALRKVQAHPEQFDLIITDQTMPGLTGVELVSAISEVSPDLPVILCTGHSQVVSRHEVLEMGIEDFVAKPISGNTLLTAVRSVLDKKK